MNLLMVKAYDMEVVRDKFAVVEAVVGMMIVVVSSCWIHGCFWILLIIGRLRIPLICLRIISRNGSILVMNRETFQLRVYTQNKHTESWSNYWVVRMVMA